MRSLVVQVTSERACAIIDGQQRMATLSLLALAVIAQPNRIAERVSASGWRKRGGRPIWTAGRPGHHRGRRAGQSFRGVDRDVSGTSVGGVSRDAGI
jgi:hypothetical protein